MSSRTAILIPTYGRPGTVARIRDSAYGTTQADCKLYFIVEPADHDTIDAVRDVDEAYILNKGTPTYASCINTAYEQTSEAFLFAGADDLRFCDKWLEEALSCMNDSQIGIVGTHDPLNSTPDHATHYLVRRTYIDNHSGCMDTRGVVLYPYRHNYTDQEVVGVAKARNAYAYCQTAVVEHLHPGWRHDGVVDHKSPLFDETYAKGNRHHAADMLLFIERSKQWLDLIDPKTQADREIARFVRLRRTRLLRLVQGVWNSVPSRFVRRQLNSIHKRITQPRR